ncbi:MAG: hypothetical protein AAF620_16755 [Bacteroidota bacterium]
MKRLIIATLISITIGAYAQTPQEFIDDAFSKITGNNEREWVHETWKREMGAQSICKSGGSFIFKSDSTVVLKDCVLGSTTEQEHTWEVVFKEPSNVTLKIIRDVFELNIYQDKKRPLVTIMKLIKTKDGKSDLEANYTFYYEPE